MLCKLNKKNYSEFFVFKSIILFNTLDKVLKLIISKRLCYTIKMYNTLLKIQIKIKNPILLIQRYN